MKIKRYNKDKLLIDEVELETTPLCILEDDTVIFAASRDTDPNVTYFIVFDEDEFEGMIDGVADAIGKDK